MRPCRRPSGHELREQRRYPRRPVEQSLGGTSMSVSRRDFLKKAASTSVVGVPSAIAEASHPEDAVSREQILEPFAHLPGDKGIKVFVPGEPGADKLSVQINPNHTLFAASAIKTYVL